MIASVTTHGVTTHWDPYCRLFKCLHKNSFFVESTDELICLSDSLSVVLTAWKPETQSVNQYSATFLQEGLQHAVCVCVLLK